VQHRGCRLPALDGVRRVQLCMRRGLAATRGPVSFNATCAVPRAQVEFDLGRNVARGKLWVVKPDCPCPFTMKLMNHQCRPRFRAGQSKGSRC